MCSEAEDAGGLTPAKDDNEAARHFIPRTLPILDCVDYKKAGRVFELPPVIKFSCVLIGRKTDSGERR